MQIEALNAQLLQSIGIGLALVAPDSLAIRYCNPTFGDWFAGAAAGTALADLFPGLDPAGLAERLSAGTAVTVEARVKRKRRELIIEAVIRRATHDGSGILVVECQNISRLRETEAMIDAYASMTERKTRELEREKTQVEKLLLNVMPRSVYEEYKTFGSVTPKLYEPVSVLMLDFVGFTEIAAAADPTVTVAELNDIFTAFDRIAELHGCERIKTIGDAYLAVAGLPHPNPDHARSVAQCAVKMMRYLERRNESHAQTWRARIGLASGSVVGSVIGIQKYVYDVFGPAVNLASRLQSLSEPMEISVHQDMLGEVMDEFALSRFRTETVRGLGEVPVATLADRDGTTGLRPRRRGVPLRLAATA
ncbi:MAG: adenylate/guanylate cyclase domain-containing protein [Sneathiellaceae bacterium]